jgi:hypothetical protein
MFVNVYDCVCARAHGRVCLYLSFICYHLYVYTKYGNAQMELYYPWLSLCSNDNLAYGNQNVIKSGLDYVYYESHTSVHIYMIYKYYKENIEILHEEYEKKFSEITKIMTPTFVWMDSNTYQYKRVEPNILNARYCAGKYSAIMMWHQALHRIGYEHNIKINIISVKNLNNNTSGPYPDQIHIYVSSKKLYDDFIEHIKLIIIPKLRIRFEFVDKEAVRLLDYQKSKEDQIRRRNEYSNTQSFHSSGNNSSSCTVQ